MNNALKFFDKELVYAWFEECKKIDAVLKENIEKGLDKFAANENCITSELEKEFLAKLTEANVSHSYHFPNMEAYHGYTVYAFPDKGEINAKSGYPDLYYGIAKTNSFGVAHTHKMSDAYNYILEGEGVFTGEPTDEGKFDFFYHRKPMITGAEFEIPIGMTHGHLVKKGSDIWFFFVQECGFKPKLRCAGDFYTVENYNKDQFGPYYI
jgi:hypothetical protein